VTRLVLSPKAVDDIDRLSNFLLDSDPSNASKTGGILVSGLQILKDHPLIGRQVERGFRELLISRGRTGYVALYEFDLIRDIAIVLSIRHQREVGYF
jgi:plasmid stabilization system protein ParE